MSSRETSPVTPTLSQLFTVDPMGRIAVGTTTAVLISTGVVFCDSARTSITTTSTSKSSRELTAEDEAYVRKKAIEQKKDEATTEEGALTRLKSSINEFHSKYDPPSLPSINLTPQTFGLPPNFLQWVDKIRAEVSFAPGSVSDEIWQESLDPIRNPEIEREARVRIGNEICEEELAFYEKRRKFTRRGLAKFLGVREHEIDERDIPTIALAGSGGGYRAMLGLTGYIKAMKESGLFDCVTYMAGAYPVGPLS
jgi:hypothetical protein